MPTPWDEDFQHNQAPGQPPQPPQPSAPPAPPAPTAGAAPQPPQPGPAPAAPSGPAAPGSDEWAEQMRQNIDSTISAAQWKAWARHYDPSGCPQNAPFHSSKNGANNACVEKPDNCPNGMQAYGLNDCVAQGSRPGTVGYGGPGGGPGGPGGNPGNGITLPGGGSGIEGDLAARISEMLKGQGSRYSPAVMEKLMAGIKQGTANSSQRQRDAAKADAASRGMLRSGRLGARLDAINRGAEADNLQGKLGIERAKIDADRQDKMDAVQAGQKWLDSLRDHLYRTDLSAMQRQQFAANLTLAYARLSQEWDSLRYSTGMNFAAGGV